LTADQRWREIKGMTVSELPDKAEPQLTNQTARNGPGARNFQIRGGGCRDHKPGQGARRCGAGYRSWRPAPTRFLHCPFPSRAVCGALPKRRRTRN